MTERELDARKERHALDLETKGSLAAEFVARKVAIGLSFAHLSLLHKSNHNVEKALENHRHAKQALKMAIKFMNQASFSDLEMEGVIDKMTALQKLLDQSQL